MERASPPYKKTPNKKHHPLKVVYISNPMKVTASAATFRAIVQELTGRDSVIADILTRQPAFHDSSPPCHLPPPRAALLPRLQPPEDAVTAEAGNSFAWAPTERFGSMEEYFAGLLPPAPLLQSPLVFDRDDS